MTQMLPQIENLHEITPETFREYVQFVADMRLNQRRFFSTRNPDALTISKEMEKQLDSFNALMLDLQPRLF